MKVKKCYRCEFELPLCQFHKCRSKKDGLQSKCKKCAYEVSKEWKDKNRDHVNKQGRSWTSNNPDKAYEKSKRWHKRNPDWQAAYKRRKRKEDPVFAMMDRARCRIWQIVKMKHRAKNDTTKNIVGCSWEELSKHIESKFVDGMSWENRSEWQIDHIIPLSSAKTEQEVLDLCHYTNLQPLWAYDNKSKGGKIIKGED